MDVHGLKESLERFAKKQKSTCEKTLELVSTIIGNVEHTKDAIEAGYGKAGAAFNALGMIEDLRSSVERLKPVDMIVSLQKDLNNALGKYGKSLDKSFCLDVEKACRDTNFDSEALHRIIARYLLSEGLFEIADIFCEEVSLTGFADVKKQYVEIYFIMDAILGKNLDPALSWSKIHREELKGSPEGVSLEFSLHARQFLHLLEKVGVQAGLQYARSNFEPFAQDFMPEIMKLMGCLLWCDKLDESPYSTMVSKLDWENLARVFRKAACSVVGEASRNPLGVVVDAGAQALPALVKLSSLLSNKREEWENMRQLPVEIELGKEFQFHSIFACPVSREQSGPENPPMLMPCGHVLCKQSILKLGRGSTRTFKCPYCPSETTANDCKPIQF